MTAGRPMGPGPAGRLGFLRERPGFLGRRDRIFDGGPRWARSGRRAGAPVRGAGAKAGIGTRSEARGWPESEGCAIGGNSL